MRAGMMLTALLTIVMTAAVIYGFVAGDFWGEGRVLTSLPWGRVSLLDVYAGFLLFSGWIAFRSRSVAGATVAILAVLILGNAFAALYALVALVRSGGDWTRFWLGGRA